MKTDFEQRWQTVTKAARQTPEERVESPLGLATRVLARFERAPVEPWLDLMTALGLRAVAAAAAVFVSSALLVLWQMDVVALTAEVIESPLSPLHLLP